MAWEKPSRWGFRIPINRRQAFAENRAPPTRPNGRGGGGVCPGHAFRVRLKTAAVVLLRLLNSPSTCAGVYLGGWPDFPSRPPMQAPNSDTPTNASQPATSATPSPVPVGSNQPPSLTDVWSDAKGSFSKLNKEEKTGCGCGIMVLVALCFLLGKCSCSGPPSTSGLPSQSVGESINNPPEQEARRTPEQLRAKLSEVAASRPLFAGGTQGLFDVVEQLRYNEIDTAKLESEIVMHKDNEQGAWMVDNVAGEAVIYSYRLTPTVPWDNSRMIRIAVVREGGKYYAEGTELPAGKFLFTGITSFTNVAGTEIQIPSFMHVD